jgi:hypothetical protein
MPSRARTGVMGGEVVIELTDEQSGEPVMTVHLHRPTYHTLLLAHLWAFEEELAEEEATPRLPTDPIPFPVAARR